MDEALKLLFENGNIELDTIARYYDMDRIERIKKKHPYKIWYGNDGYYHTYLPLNPIGRKAVKRKTEEELMKVLSDFWRNPNGNSMTKRKELYFSHRFEVWVKRQEDCGRCNNTILRYRSDYRRFIKDTDLENKLITTIDSDYLTSYLVDTVKRTKVHYRAIKQLFQIIRGVCDKSLKDKVILSNPCDWVDLPILQKHCVIREQNNDVRYITDDTDQVIRNLEYLHKLDSHNMYVYPVMLAMCTALRVGELAGLKWSDIDFEYCALKVCRAERLDKMNDTYEIINTKNSKVRIVPLTDKAKEILIECLRVQQEMDCVGEFVFNTPDGKLRVDYIAKQASRYTRTTKAKNGHSIHAIRRTINSNMRCGGVSVTECSAILGHSEAVNEANYTIDMTSITKKLNSIEAASLFSRKSI